ncbi:MAG: hypothetical protein JSV24_02720, partial [Bacteroidales bacterium]
MKRTILLFFILLVLLACEEDDPTDCQHYYTRSYPAYRPTQITEYYNGNPTTLKKFEYNEDNQLTEIKIYSPVTQGDSMQLCSTENFTYFSDGMVNRTDEYGHIELYLENELPISYTRYDTDHTSSTFLTTKCGYIVQIETKSQWINPIFGNQESSREKDTLIYDADGKLIKVDYADWYY